jgi:gamma-glutamyl phosphate reductase
MATLTTAATTPEKLLRARAAAAALALLSSEEKNALLLAIAGAVEANEKSILGANQQDIEMSGLEGAMRDRLLLTSARSASPSALSASSTNHAQTLRSTPPFSP